MRWQLNWREKKWRVVWKCEKSPKISVVTVECLGVDPFGPFPRMIRTRFYLARLYSVIMWRQCVQDTSLLANGPADTTDLCLPLMSVLSLLCPNCPSSFDYTCTVRRELGISIGNCVPHQQQQPVYRWKTRLYVPWYTYPKLLVSPQFISLNLSRWHHAYVYVGLCRLRV
jgi:hypothetical protein